jgi:hypothetical protein
MISCPWQLFEAHGNILADGAAAHVRLRLAGPANGTPAFSTTADKTMRSWMRHSAVECRRLRLRCRHVR